MAKPTRSITRSTTQAPKADGSPIVRDHLFVRVSANDTVVGTRRGTTSISFLLSSRDPVFQGNPRADENGDASQSLRFKSTLSEVAQVQIPAAEAFGMAMQIIQQALATGRVHTSAFREAVNKMLDEYAHLDVEDDDEPGDTKGTKAKNE